MKTTITGILTFLGTLLMIVVFVAIWSLPSAILNAIGVSIGLSIVVLIGAGVFYTLSFVHNWARLFKARADEATLKADFIPHDGWIKERVKQGRKTTVEYALLDRNKPLWRVNSHLRAPESYETETHIREHTSTTTQKALLLPSTTDISQVVEPDLLQVMTQLSQCYATIAGQRVGKSFQDQRINQYWISTGVSTIVIAPKWDLGEWAGANLFGGQLNYKRVEQGINVINRLAMERHESGLPFNQHPILPVFLDDWTDIRKELGELAENLVIKASTMYATVNIIMYFMLHADTVNAWGVDKIGAALHQNFIKLIIQPGFNEAGLIERSRNIGYLLWPGQSKKDMKRVRLFSGIGQPLLIPDYVKQPEPSQPRDSDALFVERVRAGASRNEASLEAWGRRYAGDLVERGKRALGEL